MTDEEALIRAKHFRSLRWWLGGALAIACGVGFALTFLTSFEWHFRMQDFWVILAGAAWYAPMGFVIGWLVFGNDSLKSRYAIVSIVLVCMGLCCRLIILNNEMLRAMMLIFVPIYALLLGLVFCCLKWSVLCLDTSACEPSNSARRFSIADMLWVTSTTAVVLAVVRTNLAGYKTLWEDQSFVEHLPTLAGLFIGIQAFSTMLVWLIVPFLSARLSLIIVVLLSWAFGYGVSTMIGLSLDSYQLTSIYMFFGLPNLFTYVFLQILRAHGYRFVWRWNKPTTIASPSS